MAARIPQSFIDDLLARTDIIDVIEAVVPLKKAGKNHQALCPFHDEKTASFTVNQDKQFYHCFGCGASGTAITFLMEYNNLGFLDALEELATRVGLEVPRQEGADTRSPESPELYELLELIVAYYRKQLREHPHAGRARDYLQGRGVSGTVVTELELGYAPAGWDHVLQAFGKSGAAQQRLLQAGMIIKRDNGGFYDRFRDRVMFPIRDERGRTVGFGGRIIDEGTPKYLNSPETAVFKKGRELYGLHQVRKSSRTVHQLFVVEGYMDVLALRQFGVGNAVATLGTAATREQLERLFRCSRKLVFCFDGDSAGKKAAWRALETTLPLLRDGRQVFFRFLPEGEDPDTFVRTHGESALTDEGQWVPLSDHLLATLQTDIDLARREGRAQLLARVAPLIDKLPGSALKGLLLEDVAKLADTTAGHVSSLLGNDSRQRRTVAAPAPRAGGKSRNLVRDLITLLLHQPGLAGLVEDPACMNDEVIAGGDFLRQLIDFIHSNPDISCAGILEHWRDTRFSHRLRELAVKSTELCPDLIDLETEFLQAVTRIDALARRLQIAAITRGARPSELTEEQKDLLRNPGLTRK